MTGPAGDPDDLLDRGAVGLEFFAAYLPRAHRLGLAGRWSLAALHDRYDEQRGLDVAALDGDARLLRDLADGLGARVDEQTRGVHALGSSWSGGAGGAAHDELDSAARRGADLHEAVTVLTARCARAVEGILAAVAGKAAAVAAFADRTIGGCTPEEVDAIIAGAQGDQVAPAAVLARWSAAAGTPVPPPDRIADGCAAWLRDVFAPGIDDALHRFLAVCDSTDDAVDDLLGAVECAFDRIDAPAGGPTAPAVPDPAAPTVRAAGPGGTSTAAGRDLAEAVEDFVTAVGELAAAATAGVAAVVAAGSVVDAGAVVAAGDAVQCPDPDTPDGAFAPGGAAPAAPAAPAADPTGGTAPPDAGGCGDGTIAGPGTSAAPPGPAGPEPAGPSGTGSPGTGRAGESSPSGDAVPGPGAGTVPTPPGPAAGPAPQRRPDPGTAPQPAGHPGPELPDEDTGGVVLAEAGPL